MRNPNTTCCGCGEPCYVRPNQLATQKMWFCSKECHGKGVYEKLAECAFCSNKFTKANSESKFCSRSCSNKGRRGIVYDGSNPGNKARAGELRRRQVIERDGINCNICGLEPVWSGKPLQHQVDHIDGNNKNHDLSNLRLLCPNCHTQTDTYGPKNVGRIKHGNSPATNSH